MKPTARTLPLAPVIRTVPFSGFVGLIAKLIAGHGEQLSFTDGYVFGAATSIDIDSGVDTLVPGGDSSYHCTDIQPDHEFRLTKYGFRSRSEHKEVQFRFVKRAELPGAIQTLGELAAFLKKNPQLLMLALTTPKEEGDSFEAETVLHLDAKKQWVDVLELCHFEDFEVIGARRSLSNPVLRSAGGMDLPAGYFTFRDRLEDLNHLMHLGNGSVIYFMLVEPMEVQW